jgi:DNA-binding HxlR family transcriptional regulator
MIKKKERNSDDLQQCPIDYGFKRIGGKYKARILWYLNKDSVLRYGELSRALPDITTKMLTQTLKELEDDKLVHREMYFQVPPRVDYSLTATGEELIPFIDHIRSWSLHQMEKEKDLLAVGSR